MLRLEWWGGILSGKWWFVSGDGEGAFLRSVRGGVYSLICDVCFAGAALD